MFNEFVSLKKQTVPQLIEQFVDNELKGYGRIIEENKIVPNVLIKKYKELFLCKNHSKKNILRIINKNVK